MEKPNTENFIKKSNIKHNNKYQYTKTIYIKQSLEVIITCPIKNHGDFKQKPKCHLKGYGCSKCAEDKIKQNCDSKRKTLEQFIKESNIIHNFKYDYSKVIYKNNTTNVIIICPIHKEFQQKPKLHLKNKESGCQICSEIRRLDKLKMSSDEFITKSNNVHNYKYTYNNINYINSFTNVLITCKNHGDFSQTPSAHLAGQGCKYCGIINRSNLLRYSTEEFINNAIKIHGDKYDYSETIYIKANLYVDIFCKIHQKKFSQRPANHLIGQGCPDCGIEKTAKNNIISFNDFKLAANLKFNNKYDYSKFNYVSLSDKNAGIIICKIHGEILARASDHLYSFFGCYECGMAKAGDKNRKSFEKFVEESNFAHHNKYDYSKFIYKNSNTYGIVICNKLNHGEFKVCPSSHINGDHRCPKCYPMSRGELIINDFLIKKNYIYTYQYPINVKLSKNKIVDFYVPSLNLIIEYNGIQHYKPVKFGNQTLEQSEEKFIAQKQRDFLIRQYCKNNNIYLLEIDGRNYLSPNTFSYIKEKIEQNLSNYIFQLKSKLYFQKDKVD